MSLVCSLLDEVLDAPLYWNRHEGHGTQVSRNPRESTFPVSRVTIGVHEILLPALQTWKYHHGLTRDDECITGPQLQVLADTSAKHDIVIA